MTFLTSTLGCKVNSYESYAVSSYLMKDGFTYDKDHPDVVIINTCSVTHVADQKSRQHIRSLKKKYPHAIIVVMGCYAQGNADYIKEECGADIIIGTSKRSQIANLIKEYLKDKKQIVEVEANPRQFCYEELGIASYSENIRAYLKIQDGCDNFCSYCIVPYRRGKARSRDFDSIILEAKELVKKGYKEIVLTGIHVGMYGQDIGTTFSNLVEELTKIDDLYRIRISSIEESEIDDKLIDLVAHNSKVAKHLHIPLQSGSDPILKRMARKYNTEQFYTKLAKIRSLLPNVCFTTDLIVGFPGETNEDFLNSYNFIQKVGFNQVHCFPYSIRPGSVAASFKDQIDPSVKNERVAKILELSNRLWDQYNKINDGKEVDVIIEKYDNNKKCYVGHSSNYLLIQIKDDNLKVGSIVKTIYKY